MTLFANDCAELRKKISSRNNPTLRRKCDYLLLAFHDAIESGTLSDANAGNTLGMSFSTSQSVRRLSVLGSFGAVLNGMSWAHVLEQKSGEKVRIDLPTDLDAVFPNP